MEVIMLLLLVLCGGYVIVFIVDTLLGKSSTAVKYKNKKILNSIDKKIANGENFAVEEMEYIKEQQSITNLFIDLNKHRK